MQKLGLVLALSVVAGAANAQGIYVGRDVPRGHMPPPGMCRVWYDNLPPGRQPPATTCERAEREAWRTGGRVIYGERWNDRRDRDDRWERERRDRDRDRRRACEARDRRRDRNACDWNDGWCRDRDRNGRCDRDAYHRPGALDDLLRRVIDGRTGVRRGPGGWYRDDVTDSIPRER